MIVEFSKKKFTAKKIWEKFQIAHNFLIGKNDFNS